MNWFQLMISLCVCVCACAHQNQNKNYVLEGQCLINSWLLCRHERLIHNIYCMTLVLCKNKSISKQNQKIIHEIKSVLETRTHCHLHVNDTHNNDNGNELTFLLYFKWSSSDNFDWLWHFYSLSLSLWHRRGSASSHFCGDEKECVSVLKWDDTKNTFSWRKKSTIFMISFSNYIMQHRKCQAWVFRKRVRKQQLIKSSKCFLSTGKNEYR